MTADKIIVNFSGCKISEELAKKLKSSGCIRTLIPKTVNYNGGYLDIKEDPNDEISAVAWVAEQIEKGIIDETDTFIFKRKDFQKCICNSIGLEYGIRLNAITMEGE